jgi:hypothetical protein
VLEPISLRAQRVTDFGALIIAVLASSHRGDQAPKSKQWVVARSRPKIARIKRKKFFAAGLDKVGFIEA